MKVEINLNENIKIKIKPEGYQYMADRHNELVKDVPSLKCHSAEHYEMKADKDGYTKMQLHAFIALFGPFCEGGFSVPFETNILINTEF